MQRQKVKRKRGKQQKGEVYWRLEVQRVDGDLTAPFPVVGIDGVRYFLISVYVDEGYIHSEPVNDRTAGALAAAYEKTIAFFRDLAGEVEMLRIDNETSTELYSLFRRVDVD
jgi:hypothetical protein